MRKFTCFLLIGCAAIGTAMLAGAAETWRWKDANGVTHYSDRPVPGAERVNVATPKPVSQSPQAAVVDSAAAPAVAAAPKAPPIVPYTRCVIIAPNNEETFNAVNSVTVSVYLEPNLQEGHRVEAQLDGNNVTDWPQDGVSHQVTGLLRGAHSVTARVLDADGGMTCTTPAVTFHIRLPTVPQARPQPRGG